MLRSWAPNDTWRGNNWRGLGYNVYAHFPEFPPDGDPTNDEIGDLGSVGTGDLPVDYQATSHNFWRLIDHYQPHVLITTSRGGVIEWELEAIEGGHGETGNTDPALDWIEDRFGEVMLPTQESIAARSWHAISEFRAGHVLPSQLPLSTLMTELSKKDILTVEIDEGTSGNYLSGFMGLHGLYYNKIATHNLTAGHIHVGRHVSVEDATAMMEATLEIVLRQFPAATVCKNEARDHS